MKLYTPSIDALILKWEKEYSHGDLTVGKCLAELREALNNDNSGAMPTKRFSETPPVEP